MLVFSIGQIFVSFILLANLLAPDQLLSYEGPRRHRRRAQGEDQQGGEHQAQDDPPEQHSHTW